jgi:predicted GNAT family acetyltransferase
MSVPTITREDRDARGRYVARVQGIDAEAELVFNRSSPTLVVAEHTEVPDVFRGQGVGRLLVTRMVEDARAQGFKIFALCTYVNAERKKHPEWADVFQD